MSTRPRPQLAQRQRLRLTQGLTAAVRILRFDASGLARYLEEQAAENPHLRLEEVPVAPSDWLPRWTGAFAPRREGAEAGEVETLAASAPSLMAHVAAEIARLVPPGRPRELAFALAGALEPTGWLGRPLAAIAAEEGASVPELEDVLARLRGIDPPGLFARSLAECLELQAREAGLLDAAMAAALANLPLVAAGEVARLARVAGTTEDAMHAALRRLRGFNPKPGAVFDPVQPAPREPDLIARPAGEGWIVELNRAALPAVRVATPDRGAASEVARRQTAEARSLARMVEARGRTLLRIGAEIALRQSAALRDGPRALVPMTMADVAGAVGLHATTVGRAVAGVSMDTPRGPVWLRRLFSAATGGGDVAAAAVRARLSALIAAEDPANPLDDAALAEALAAAGLGTHARRTVAKYRAMLGLPAARLRRRTIR